LTIWYFWCIFCYPLEGYREKCVTTTISAPVTPKKKPIEIPRFASPTFLIARQQAKEASVAATKAMA